MINMLLVIIRLLFVKIRFFIGRVFTVFHVVILIVHFDWLLFWLKISCGKIQNHWLKEKCQKIWKTTAYYRRNEYWLSKWYFQVCFGSYDVSGLLSGGCLDMNDRLFEMSVSRKYWYKTYLFNFSCCQFWSSKYIFSKSSE